MTRECTERRDEGEIEGAKGRESVGVRGRGEEMRGGETEIDLDGDGEGNAIIAGLCGGVVWTEASLQMTSVSCTLGIST
jgi:hypothetical protein